MLSKRGVKVPEASFGNHSFLNVVNPYLSDGTLDSVTIAPRKNRWALFDDYIHKNAKKAA
ncbi:hypothetical protein ABE61_17495 [Lysinibacillus sphaericus]|nr:hypothetical protein [Lysinibacillus sphaericus]MBG9477815.1 hypothetical protein [Lysinibacillus sphaericus]MBG9593274.1 hypothetical protein [Lysinibacillus sphaericus]